MRDTLAFVVGWATFLVLATVMGCVLIGALANITQLISAL